MAGRQTPHRRSITMLSLYTMDDHGRATSQPMIGCSREWQVRGSGTLLLFRLYAPRRAFSVSSLVGSHFQMLQLAACMLLRQWHRWTRSSVALAPGPLIRSRFVPPTPPSPKARAPTTSRSMAASIRASLRSQGDIDPESGGRRFGYTERILSAWTTV